MAPAPLPPREGLGEGHHETDSIRTLAPRLPRRAMELRRRRATGGDVHQDLRVVRAGDHALTIFDPPPTPPWKGGGPDGDLDETRHQQDHPLERFKSRCGGLSAMLFVPSCAWWRCRSAGISKRYVELRRRRHAENDRK